MSITVILADEIVRTDRASIPDEAMSLVRAMFVDHVGIAFMGHQFTGEGLIGYARELGGAQEALLLGTDVHAPAEIAAGVNGQLAQNAGMENTGPGLHAGPLVVHTALAVGQRTGASGAEVLTAIALGYDLNARFHLARTADEDLRHLNMVGAAVAARLLGLDVGATADALSMAWEFPMRQRLYLKPKIPKRVSAFPMGHLFTARSRHPGSGHGPATDTRTWWMRSTSWGTSTTSTLSPGRSPGYESITRGLFLKPYVASHLCHMVLQTVSELVDANDDRPRGDHEDRRRVTAHLHDSPPERSFTGHLLGEHLQRRVGDLDGGPSRTARTRLVYAGATGRSLIESLGGEGSHCRAPACNRRPGTKGIPRGGRLGPARDGWTGSDRGPRRMAETYGSPDHPDDPCKMLEEKFLRVSRAHPRTPQKPRTAWSQVEPRSNGYDDIRELTPDLVSWWLVVG